MVKREGKRKLGVSKSKAANDNDHGSSSHASTAVGGLRAPAPSVVESPYPAFTIMQSSEMILARGGAPHDAEIAAFIGTTSHDHSFDAKQLAAADAPAGINPSALRKAAFALGLGGPDKRPKLKPLMQRPHTAAEISAPRDLEMITAAAGMEAEELAAVTMTGGNAHPSTPSPSKMSPRETSKYTHVSQDRPSAVRLTHPPSLSLPASNKPSPRPPPRGPWTRSPRAETARGASDVLGADELEAFPLEASNMPSFLGALRPAELSALGAQLQAQQLMAYARSTLQQARSGAAARAASRGNVAQTTGVLPRRQLSSRVLQHVDP